MFLNNVFKILIIYLLCPSFEAAETLLRVNSAKAYFNILVRLRNRYNVPKDRPGEHTARFRICWPARLFRCFRRARYVCVFSSGSSEILSAKMSFTWARLQPAPIVSPGKQIVYIGDMEGAVELSSWHQGLSVRLGFAHWLHRGSPGT